MNKMIIKNYTECDDLVCLEMVRAVVNDGKISKHGEEDGYCFVTTFTRPQNTMVCCSMTKNGTHVFDIRECE